MEGFLSLPRSAKGGLAVLLAVALLGWGIVAYSAKRQHEDARSLDNAIATLKSQEEREATAVAELASLNDRFAAAEAELSSNRETMAASREVKSTLDAKVAELETALLTMGGKAEGTTGQGGALALLDRGDGDQSSGSSAGGGQTSLADAETLRSRLTETMRKLSAKSATLEQRDRQLARLEAEHEAMLGEAGAADTEEGAGNEALDANRKAIAEQETRLKTLADQQAVIEETISEKEVVLLELEQKLGNAGDGGEPELAARKGEIDAAKAVLSTLTAAQGEAEAKSSSLTAEIEDLEATLSDKQDAIAFAETELGELKEKIVIKEAEFEEKRSVLSAKDAEIRDAQATLAALKDDQGTSEATTTALAAAKGEPDVTKAEPASQTARAKAEQAGESSGSGSYAGQTLPRIPIAALSLDNPAILPVDPMQHPFPVQTKGGVRLSLIHFDLGSAALTPGAVRRAKETAAWIKEQDIEKITLVGATDTIGTRQNNKALARRRAQTLFDTFAAEGIDPDRITLLSLGEAGGSEIIGDQTAEPLNRCVGVFIGGNG